MGGDIFSFAIAALKTTWWFFTPLAFWFIFKDLWLYNRAKKYINSVDYTLLEVRVPQDILKTPKAMEYVFVGLHGVWDELNARDKWIKGESLPVFSLEIAGVNGEIKFYIYTETRFRSLVESKIYSQYPDAEIFEADDYTNLVPPDVPNGEWDVWGTDMKLLKEDPYPIRTYPDFEEQVEERRLDSMASIAEVINKLSPGQYIWIQIIISPILNELRESGEKLLTKLLGRPEEKKKGILKPYLGDVLAALNLRSLIGEDGEESAEDVFALPEFRLSGGEREIIKKIEEKTSKVAFRVLARWVYVGRRDIFTKANLSGFFGFFRQFNTHNLNGFRPNANTLPKKSFIFFRKTRTYMRKFRIFNWYKRRETLPGGISPKYKLNVEELASIYHFPAGLVKAPSIARVESRKAPPPATLPVEEY